MDLEKDFLEVDKELEKAKEKAKAKRKKLKEKAERKCFSNAKLLERELRKLGVEVEKPLYALTREEVVALAVKIAPKSTENFLEEPEDFELDYDC